MGQGGGGWGEVRRKGRGKEGLGRVVGRQAEGECDWSLVIYCYMGGELPILS